MLNLIFKIVAGLLYFTGRRIGLTYNEINIVVYYFLVPLSWLILLDMIFQFHYFKFTWIIFTTGFAIGCRNFRSYADWLFGKSVSFLNYFNRFGSNYVASSVWICVAVPIVIYSMLIFLLIK
jgi:hypothetical protein